MQLYYNAARKYKNPIPTEAGKNLRYDIKELRESPGKTNKNLAEEVKQDSSQSRQENEWAEWETYQRKLGN